MAELYKEEKLGDGTQRGPASGRKRFRVEDRVRSAGRNPRC